MKPQRDRSRRLASLLAGLLMAACMPLSCTASITVMDSGERYKSRPDHHYGRAFHRGYEYMARLQYIEHSPSLCPQKGQEPINLTHVPPDELPVALLANSMGCSLDEKVRFVLDYIFPKDVVKYLIIDDRTLQGKGLRSLAESESGEEEEDDVDEDYSPSVQAIFGFGPESFQVDADSPFFLDGASSSLGVMHVSIHNYLKLHTMVKNQSHEKERAGGPRIILDGGWRVGNRQVIVWMAISALLSACACTFLLVVHNGSVFWFQQEEEAPQQPQRERRRRLTREQVRRMLPPYIFDGVSLHPYHSSSHPPPPPPDPSASEGLLASATSCPHVPEGVELECCSICLDDYEAGDKLRCLPCNHAFHYRCIGRWLAERSATCPLCKTELWDEEEEDSSDEEEENDVVPPAGATTMGWRQLVELLSFTPEGGHENLETANARQQQQGGGEEVLSSEPSFWRRWLSQRRGGRTHADEQGVALNSLSEPLLQAENGQVASNAEARTAEPRPDPPEGGSPDRE